MEVTPLLQMARQSADQLRANTADITTPDSLAACVPGGNPLNWVLGHVVYWRDQLTVMAGGRSAVDGALDRYRGSPGRPARAPFDPSWALPMEALLLAWSRSHEGFTQQLGQLSESDLDRATPDGKSTLGQMLVALLGHELYHVGQLGLLRRAVGKALT